MKLNKFVLTFIVAIMITTMFATVYPGFSNESGLGRKLGFGDIGSDVRWVQEQLNQKGYPVGSVDGVYGFTTYKQVKEYQAKNDLKVSGIVDEQTYSELIKKPIKKGNKNESKIRDKKQDIKLSQKDLMLVARAVNGEARGESFKGQVAVAAVIINRVESPDFPETVSGVIFQKGAFDAVDDNQIWLEPTEKSIKAAYEAARGTDNTGEALFYYNPSKTSNKWIWSRPVIKRIGQHVFAK